MKCRKWVKTVSAAIIVCLGLGNAWADDEASCEKLFQAKQYEQAFLVCRKATENGLASVAQFYLGTMYYNGFGVKQDYPYAAKWYRKAAEQGEAVSQFMLGELYYKGMGVEQDYTEAAKWYRKAADQGDVMAQFGIGEMYHNGKGVKQDYTEAVKWYRKSADQGLSVAQLMLGGLYSNGKGVKQDYTEAVKWYRKSADQGDPDAQVMLGLYYAIGDGGVIQSGAAAADWFYKAGLSFLKEDNRDKALTTVELIKKQGNTPNAFLAGKLLAQIYGGRVATQTLPNDHLACATPYDER